MSENRERGLSVTVKYKDDKGKGYDQPWVVFQGTVDQIREDIIAFFGLIGNETKDAEGNDLALHYLVLNANEYAHLLRRTLQALPGKVVDVQQKAGGWDADKPDAWQQAQNTPQEATGATEKPAEQEPVESPADAVIEALGAAHDEQSLKRIWANERQLFGNPDYKDSLIAAYKARQAELKKND